MSNAVKEQKETKKSVVTTDTDIAAKNIWLCLLRDFREIHGPEFARKAEESFLCGIATYRNYSYPELGIVSTERFKAYAQLSGLLKKYRFKESEELLTDEMLELLTLDKHFLEQQRLSTYIPVTMLRHRVVQRARKIARRILGKYDPEKTVTLSRFGKKSSIGCSLADAYIDHKLTNVAAFTGSSEASKWFFASLLPGDEVLKELVHKLGVQPGLGNLGVEYLKLVNVPKTWKALRPITPLTLLSLLYSYGVGEQVTDQLKLEGLDISRLQQRHRKLIEEYSVDLSHATADLSNASQALTPIVLNQILPRDWYNAMKVTFSHTLLYKYKIEGVEYEGSSYTESVLPMGNGLTFPVETLVFYSVLKALAELSEVRGTISVYGDDLIYPSKLHRYVSAIFPMLGFTLNLDKTFVKAPFRESCGSDYYCGVDVRPAFLPGQHQCLSPSKYTVWLYKVYNTLSRRWSPEKIPSTLRYILTELALTNRPIFRVPPSFPDTAGIKVLHPWVIPMDARLMQWSPVDIYLHGGSRWFVFSFLHEQPNKRAVISVLPHYWLALQGKSDDLENDNFWTRDFSYLDDSAPSPLTWKRLKPEYHMITRKNGSRYRKKVVRYVPQSHSRSGMSIVMKTTLEDPSSDWI